MDAVRSGIVVCGGGDIVFGAKRSNQWMQYSVDAVCSMQLNSGIWWWGHCLWCKKVKLVDAVDAVCSMQWNSGVWWWGHCLWCKKIKPVDAVCSGIGVCGGGDIVFGAKRSNQWMQWTQYAVCSTQYAVE